MKLRSPEVYFAVVFDKICITAAAENSVEHSRRKPCGSALSPISFGEPNEVRSSSDRKKTIVDHSSPGLMNRHQVMPSSEPVIQPVYHPEPARQVDPANDSIMANMLCNRASSSFDLVQQAHPSAQHPQEVSAEHLIEGAASARELPTEDDVHADNEVEALAEKVHLLSMTFKGMKAKQFQEMLSQSDDLQRYLAAAPLIKAMVFVKPHQRDAVLSMLHGRGLRPFHIVIAESLEEHLAAALESAGSYRNRPRSKREGVLLYGSKHCTKKTFLCEVRNLQASHNVIQSTTEATTQVANPRRYL